MRSKEIMLRVEGVTKKFGALQALRDVSFVVKKGEIFGIAGPNGAGKTTLFNAIAGQFSYSGKILLDGENISGLRPHQICHKGAARTFQIPQVFSRLSVLEHVKIGAHYGLKRGQNKGGNINQVIDLVGLQGKENFLGSDLDLFTKKQTMLAASLATKPKLLLLDEPAAGLSPTEITEFMNLVRKINKKGLTIVIIEHLMDVIMELCNQLMILHNGEKICIGFPQEVVQKKTVIEVYLGADHA